MSFCYSLFMKKNKNDTIYKSNSYYHIYNRGNHKRKIFFQEKDYGVFERLMYKYFKKYTLMLVAYCYMPNHYHFIIKCGHNWNDIPKFMGCFMTSYVMYFNRKYLKVGHLFQGPFQVRRIIGRRDLESTIQYLRNNPVEAGLVSSKEVDSYQWLYIRKWTSSDDSGGVYE